MHHAASVGKFARSVAVVPHVAVTPLRGGDSLAHALAASASEDAEVMAEILATGGHIDDLLCCQGGYVTPFLLLFVCLFACCSCCCG